MVAKFTQYSFYNSHFKVNNSVIECIHGVVYRLPLLF